MNKKYNKNITVCDECGSEYYSEKSEMNSLCPECTHIIYGYNNCDHVFDGNCRCTKCHWDVSKSQYFCERSGDYRSRIKRIEEMEQLYDSCSQSVSQLIEAAEKYLENKRNLDKLFSYYESKAWLEDFDADRRGDIPQTLKRGVLAEDTIYGLITDEVRLKAILEKILNYESDN